MIDPNTGLEEKDFTSTDTDDFLSLLQTDSMFLFKLRSILNTGGMRSGGGGSSGDTLWEEVTYSSVYLKPTSETEGLLIGYPVASSLSSAFTATSAFFNDSPSTPSQGTNFFVNMGYGTSFVPFGGLFVGGRALGTASVPTQTTTGLFLGGMAFLSFDGSAWVSSSANHVLPALSAVTVADTTAGSQEIKINIGGFLTPMFSFNTLTSAIMFNEAQIDSDITFYSDTGTPLTIDGATTGTLIIGDATNIQINTTTGTKIGTGTTQKIGFWNSTPVVQSTGWSVSNETTDKSFDADATTLDEIADVLGTLIETLKTYGILGA